MLRMLPLLLDSKVISVRPIRVRRGQVRGIPSTTNAGILSQLRQAHDCTGELLLADASTKHNGS